MMKAMTPNRSALRTLATLAAIMMMSLTLGGCNDDDSAATAEADPSFFLDVEQVRFDIKGVFPFDFLIGRAYLTSAKPLPSNNTWYPDPSRTPVRIFEDGVERPVLRVTSFAREQGKLNLMVVVPVTRSLAVGPGGGVAFEPRLVEALQRLADGYDESFYNLAMVFCWGSTERRYPFMSADGIDDIRGELSNLTFPGPPSGSYMDCIEPALADLDWLQRADPALAQEAARQRGTLPLFFEGNQNGRTQVLLITDGVPFREGPLNRFSDILVQGNLPLYTLGLGVSAQGERGLARLSELYQRRRMGGKLTTISDHTDLVASLQASVDEWLERDVAFMAEYVSGFSGERGTELSVWASWKDGQYTSREVRIVPGRYQGTLRWGLRVLAILCVLGFGVYVLYRLRWWPFREEARLVPCPEGCGHLIPEAWPVCRFCELRGAWGRLVLLNGDRAGEVFYLKHDHYALGSSADDDIVLTHLKDYPVSPAHAELHRLEGGEKIALKLGGGHINVERREYEGDEVVNLRYGDVLQFGDKGVATILLRGVERLY